MITKDILNKKGTFSKIYAKNLKINKEQIINVKLIESDLEFFNKTEYYCMKVKETNLILKDHTAKGNFELLLPVISFNKMIDRAGKEKWLQNNFDKYVQVKFKIRTKHKYDLLSIYLS